MPESPAANPAANPLLQHLFEQAENALDNVSQQSVRTRAAYYVAAEREFVFVDCALRHIGRLPALGAPPGSGRSIDWSHPHLERYAALQALRSDTLAAIPEDTRARLLNFDAFLARDTATREQFAMRYGRESLLRNLEKPLDASMSATPS